MKIRIGNLLDGTARRLLVAGSLGVPAAVLAQTAISPSHEKPIPLTHSVDEVESPQQTAHLPHVIEMKVELAWLADPLTSCCRLEARTVGGTLEVRGQVPNQAILG
jgi:hypothetical protein